MSTGDNTVAWFLYIIINVDDINYGPQSTGILKNLILNKNVNIVVNNTDRYGRKVAWVYFDKQDINAEMIRLGAAWHYKYYDKSSKISAVR